jgi:hypothetical protein
MRGGDLEVKGIGRTYTDVVQAVCGVGCQAPASCCVPCERFTGALPFVNESLRKVYL